MALACLISFISPAWDLVKGSWNCVVNRANYFSDLKSNVKSLKEKKERLLEVKKAIESKVTSEEKQLKKCTPKVRLWLNEVDRRVQQSLEETIKNGEEEIQKKWVRCFFPKNFCAYEEVGKNVNSELIELNQMISEGLAFDVVTEIITSDDLVDEKPIEKIVGLESDFNQVWKWLVDDDQSSSVSTIGIYGMGGVGKTTLLKKVNNQFLATSLQGLDAVIWVVVSKEANIEKIQEAICNKLHVPEELWKDKNEEERAGVILRLLTGKKFVLLLDDLWKHLDLRRIGIPSREKANGSKLVFTTRSEQVCGSMGAEKTIKVECLAPKETLQLFRMYVGEGVLNAHGDIPKLAEMVAERCQGLPLALITIGRAMASRRNPKDWEHALKVLQSYPSKFSGMGDNVFPILKFSYDSLTDDTLKSCFLYCSIFPEDHIIEKDELIELWIQEGFLVTFDDRYAARNEGESIIESLRLACLLEQGGIPQDWTGDPKDYIRMHDVIRDMALWLASNHEIKMVVLEDAALIKEHGFEKWKEVKRLSLLGKSFEDFTSDESSAPPPPSFPYLLTLFVRETKLKRLPDGFFQHMQALKVLDLSRNWSLIELPTGIDPLINLQHLNLSHTAIKSLPLQVKILRKLKSLLMDGTYDLTNIPRGVISSLPLLQVFYKTQITHAEFFDEIGLLEELSVIENLIDLCITLTTLNSIQKVLSSTRLGRSIRGFLISTCKNLTSFELSCSFLRRAEHLEVLAVINCPLVQELKIYPAAQEEHFQNLQQLNIWGCPRIKDLSSWVIHAPRLQTLVVSSCASIEEIIAENFSSPDMAKSLFLNITFLILKDLPQLKSICKQTLPFRYLQVLRVMGCPNLKRLPFDSTGARNNLEMIEATQEWWNELQWQDDDARLAFSSKFHPYNSQEEANPKEFEKEMKQMIMEALTKENLIVSTRT